MAQCSRHNYQPLNLTALFRTNSESIILFETAPAATFLHRWPLYCSNNYSPAPATIFLHQQISAATSSAPATTSLEPATTFLYQQIPATTSPGPVTTFLDQQIPVLNQRPSSFTSRNQSCTSNPLSIEY